MATAILTGIGGLHPCLGFHDLKGVTAQGKITAGADDAGHVAIGAGYRRRGAGVMGPISFSGFGGHAVDVAFGANSGAAVELISFVGKAVGVMTGGAGDSEFRCVQVGFLPLLSQEIVRRMAGEALIGFFPSPFLFLLMQVFQGFGMF